MVNSGKIGICECYDDAAAEACFSQQLVLRVESAAAGLFLLLLSLWICSCRSVAARSFGFAKFAFVPLASAVLLFAPNNLMSIVGEAASVLSALFLVMQSLVVIDVAYTWNTRWYSAALASRPSTRSLDGRVAWQSAILTTSVLLCLVAVGMSTGLLLAFQSVAARLVVGLTLVVIFAELLLSITEWCEQGALLTSATVAVYVMCCALGALARLPEDLGGGVMLWLRWAEVAACTVSLGAVTQGVGMDDEAACDPVPAATSDSEAEDDGPLGFARQLAIHAAAPAYVASALAPHLGWLAFSSRTAALILTLLMYGWSLVAPQLLPDRKFT